MADHNPPEPATGRPGLPGGIKPYSNADADRGLMDQTRDVYTEWRKRQQPKSAVTQADVMAGGESDVVVGYTGRMKREVDKILAERLIAIKRAKETAGSAQPRSNLDTVIDRLVEEHASEIIGDNTLTPEKLAIVNAVTYDTLLNKAAAVSMLIAEDPGRLEGLRQTPFLRKFTTTLQPRVEPMAAGYRSDLADIYGVTPANLQKTVDELESLDMLRVKTIEANFPFRRGSIQSVADRIRGFVQPIDDYGGHRSPLFDLIETSIHPRSFVERSGNIWQDRIIDKFLGERGQRNGLLQQEFGENANPAEVWARNPDRYWALLEQANKTALGDAASEMAQKSLEKKQIKDGDYISKIDTRIKQLGSRSLPVDEREIPESDVTNLQTRVTTLQNDIKTKNNELIEVDNPLNTATREQRAAAQKALILRNQIANYRTLIANLPAAAGVVAGDPPEIAQAKKTTQDTKIKEYNTKISELTTQQAEQVGIVAEKAELIRQLNQPEQVAARAQQRRDINNSRRPLLRQLREAQAELRTARTGRERQQRIKNGEFTPEQIRRAWGLEKIRDMSVNQFSDIMMKFFNSRTYTGNSREILTSTRRLNGVVEGAEAWRQALMNTFRSGTSDADRLKFLYEPQRDRELFDEYFIGRSVIELLHLQNPVDVNVPLAAGVVGRAIGIAAATNGMVAVDARVREIHDLLITPAVIAAPAQVTALRNELHEIGSQVLEQVLPHMRRSNFDMGDLAQYMINKKVRICATTGDPFVAEADFQAPSEPHRFEPERVISAGLGNVETGYEGNNLMVNWEGDAPNSFGANNLPVRTQVDLQVAPNNGNRAYDFRIRADQDLVAALQGVAFAVVPPQIQAALYPGGVLDPSRARDQWINVAEGTNIGVRPNINALYGANPVIDNRVNLNNLYDASLAAHVLTMNPDERRELLGAMEEINLVLPAPLGNRIINMDNGGELWLVNPADRNDRQELRDMLVQQVRQGMQVANLARLNPEQMLAANQILRVNVLNQLGGAIFNSLSGRGRRII